MKREDREVMELFKCCLQQLYRAAGLDYPEEFDPDIESSRIAAALNRVDSDAE